MHMYDVYIYMFMCIHRHVLIILHMYSKIIYIYFEELKLVETKTKI